MILIYYLWSILSFTEGGTRSVTNASAEPPPEHSEFSGYSFEHSREMVKVFNQVFGLQKFRRHQLEACNAALLKRDTFVLMPTGINYNSCLAES